MLRPDIVAIQKEVADYFRIKLRDLAGPKRHRAVAHPRMVSMYLARKLTMLSYPEIGAHYGGKDHSTVISAVKKIERLCLEDAAVRKDVEILKRRLTVMNTLSEGKDMALGNWATLAVRFDGTLIDTVKVDWQKSPSGVLVEIYKNWVYVNDELRPHASNDTFVHPCAMSVRQGDLTYADWSILACRGPQDGIYLAAWFHEQREERSAEPRRVHGFVGCGVYGYDDHTWVGVKPGSVDFLRGWIASVADELPEQASKVVIPFEHVNQGSAFFGRNIPKVLTDPNFDPEKAR